MYLRNIWNNNFLFASFAVLLQQLIVASSTLWLTSLIISVQAGKFSFFLFAIYLASLFLPYFPGAFAMTQLAKGKEKQVANFIRLFTKKHFGNVIEWVQQQKKAKYTALLSQEVPHTIYNAATYFYDLLSSGLNVLLNLLMIAFLIEPYLLVAYGIGLCGAIVILKLQAYRKQILSLRAQQGRANWTSLIFKLWDNVLLGNKYNFNIWNAKVERRERRLIGSSYKAQVFSQFIGVSLALTLLLPSFLLLAYEATYRSNDTLWLAMMIVTLPRLFQILGYSYELLFFVSEWPLQKGHLRTIFDLLTIKETDNSSLEERINWKELKVQSSEGTFDLKKPKIGRYTLQGDNGTGKTSLLLLIKMLQEQNAFFLPSKGDLCFRHSHAHLSTGQQSMETLQEIVNRVDDPIILLDEWDAHLSQSMREKYSKIIDQLAKNKSVIEARHNITN